MRFRIPIVFTALALGLAACAGTSAQRPKAQLAAGASCSGLDGTDAQVAALYAGKVRDVQPVHRTQFIARAIQPRYVAGAKFTVPAERGMTEAYLERTLSCHAVAGSNAAHPNDPLRVEGVDDVDVTSRGPNFQIAVTSSKRGAGKTILERARALESTRVEVQQVAAANQGQSSL